jgi:hypothetical protein
MVTISASSGSVNATINGSVPISVGSSRVAISGTTGNGSTTLYTVPALKKARIWSATLEMWIPNLVSGSGQAATLSANGVEILRVALNQTAAATAGQTPIMKMDYSYIEIAAGQTIVVSTSNIGGVTGGLNYSVVYEELTA